MNRADEIQVENLDHLGSGGDNRLKRLAELGSHPLECRLAYYLNSTQGNIFGNFG